MDNNWKKLIGSLAPTIATALGGPFAGVAVQALGKAFNIDNAQEEDIANKLIGATPEDLLKIKQAEQQFILEMRKAEIDIMKINAEDRDSARTNNVQSKDPTPKILAWLVVIGYMLVQYSLFNHVIAGEMREIIMRSLGTLDAMLGMVFTYYFGSSSGSAQKTELLARSAAIK